MADIIAGGPDGALICQFERPFQTCLRCGGQVSMNPRKKSAKLVGTTIGLPREVIAMVASIQPVAFPDVALSVRDLTVALPKDMERLHAVENISFDLKRGQILCIIGESGSGKSVTANAVMGLLPKTIRISSGTIQLDGENIIGMAPDKLRSLRGRVVSMIFQDPLS